MIPVAGVGEAREHPDKVLVHPKLAALFGALDEEGLSWCVLRGAGDLLAPAGDVDLLLARRDCAQMRRIAEDLGFGRVPAWGYGSHVFLLSYDEDRDIWIKLDVVTELAFGPGFSLATGVETESLARRHHMGGVPVLAGDDAFWALLLHQLLDKEAVAAGEATRLTQLAEGAGKDGPLARFVDSFCPPGWSAGRIVGEVERGDWASLADLAPRLAANWRRQWRTEVWRRTITNRFRRWSGKWLRLSRRRGLSVALLGPDGAGKSTLAAGIERSFYFPVRYVYMGFYQRASGRLPGRRAPGVRLASRLARQWGRWLKAAYHQRRGRLVLFDRYSYETLVPSRHRHSRRGRARRWLLGHSCPSPDLVLLLDAPGELLYARKGEHDVALLERQREGYRALLPRFSRAFVLDASRDADRVRASAMALIWCEYRRHWKRRG